MTWRYVDKAEVAEETGGDRKRVSALDKYVTFSIVVLLLYTVVERYLTYRTGVSADTLTTCFYAAFGGEILTCGLIKIFKLREGGEA